ncbi:MAG: hypothetical protein AB1489_13975 [Acidobacteriota bacterium]
MNRYRQQIDYDAQHADDREFIEQALVDVHTSITQRTRDSIVIGRHLSQIREEFGDLHLQLWIKKELDWNYDQVTRFIDVAKRFACEGISPELESIAIALLAEVMVSEKMGELISRPTPGKVIDFSKARRALQQRKNRQ